MRAGHFPYPHQQLAEPPFLCMSSLMTGLRLAAVWTMQNCQLIHQTHKPQIRSRQLTQNRAHNNPPENLIAIDSL